MCNDDLNSISLVPEVLLKVESDVPGGVKKILSEINTVLSGIQGLDLSSLRSAIG